MQKPKSVRPWQPEQTTLLPPSPSDWLPDDRQVYFLLDLVAVDSNHQVLVAVGVSNQPPDVEHLEPMLQRIASSAGAQPDVMSMDAGY